MYGELVGEELQLKPMSISIQFLKTIYSIARSKNSCTVIFNNDFSELDDISKFIAINSATVFKLNNHKVQKEYNFINITSDEEMLYILQRFMGNFQELHRDSISNLFRHSSGYEDNTDLINHNIQKFKTEQLAEFSRICSNMEKSFF